MIHQEDQQDVRPSSSFKPQFKSTTFRNISTPTQSEPGSDPRHLKSDSVLMMNNSNNMTGYDETDRSIVQRPYYNSSLDIAQRFISR